MLHDVAFEVVAARHCHLAVFVNVFLVGIGAAGAPPMLATLRLFGPSGFLKELGLNFAESFGSPQILFGLVVLLATAAGSFDCASISLLPETLLFFQRKLKFPKPQNLVNKKA